MTSANNEDVKRWLDAAYYIMLDDGKVLADKFREQLIEAKREGFELCKEKVIESLIEHDSTGHLEYCCGCVDRYKAIESLQLPEDGRA